MWSVDPQAYEAHKKSEKRGDNKKHKNVSLKTSFSVKLTDRSLNLALCFFLKLLYVF